MQHEFTPMTFPAPIAQQLREDGWSIAITGASGWMGQALLELLEPVFSEQYDTRVAAFGSAARKLQIRSGREVMLRPTTELAQLPAGKWLLVHAAYGTKDRVSTQGNDAFINANDHLTQTVTQAIRALRPAAILFPSSGAVYDADGTIGTDLTANPYGVLKHRDEAHFTALAQEVGARIIIPRLFNMSGPYINKWSAYALSDLIVQLLDGKKLTIQSPGPVIRSYIHVRDLLTLCVSALLDTHSETPLIFDTRGPVDVELADLAQTIEMVMHGAVQSPPRVAAASLKGSIYLGRAEPMAGLCARYGIILTDMTTQIKRTAEDMIRRR